ncbi:MAG: M56 family metallopeptidase [Pseudomonadota bacterium]
MSSWFALNCAITVVALIAVLLLRNSPARLSFMAAFAALLCWCIPLEPIVISSAPALVAEYDLVALTPDILLPTSLPMKETPANIWLTAMILTTLAGLVVFLVRFWRSRAIVRRLDTRSRPAQVAELPKQFKGSAKSICVTPGNVAMTTGYLQPRVWVGEDLLVRPEIRSVLAHELTHAKRRDNFWVLVIEAIRHALWWNPLVWRLATTAKTRLEMSCDEACMNAMAGDTYLEDLGRLAQLSTLKGSFTSSAIINGKAIMSRIQHLSAYPRLRVKHLAVLGSAVALVLSVVIQAEEKQPSPLDSSASSSLTIADDGSYELKLENAHYGAAIQMLASLGRLHVLAHPEINQHRITITLVGTTENWMDGVNGLVQATTHFRERFGVKQDGGNLLLAPKDLLLADNRGWLDEALIMGYMKPRPDELSELRISADLIVAVNSEEISRNDLLLMNKNWFGVRQGGYELNVKPTVLETEQILLEFRLSETKSRELVATPSLLTAPGKRALLELETGESSVRVAVIPSMLD